jgi:type IV secretory pathway VirB2 component (pilin)
MKYIKYILILSVLITFLYPTTHVKATSQYYQLLAPLPCENGTALCNDGKLEQIDPAIGFSAYLNTMLKIFIGLCAVLAVIMIVIGGIEVMTSELSHTKEHGKETIEHAILGLVIALGAYALLFTINPDLLKSNAKIPDMADIKDKGSALSEFWYFQYWSVAANTGVVAGPYESQQICLIKSSTSDLTRSVLHENDYIVEGCNRVLDPTKRPKISRWYFKYNKIATNKDIFSAGYPTYDTCSRASGLSPSGILDTGDRVLEGCKPLSTPPTAPTP